jgi:hypothetical protein
MYEIAAVSRTSIMKGLFGVGASDFLIYLFSVCAEQPILAAIEETAAHRNGCSAS